MCILELNIGHVGDEMLKMVRYHTVYKGWKRIKTLIEKHEILKLYNCLSPGSSTTFGGRIQF